MARWIDVCGTDEVPLDRPLGLEVEGVSLALARSGEDWVAVHDRCPHMDFPLSQGRVEGRHLVCAWHHWELPVFDEPTASTPPEVLCQQIPVRTREGRVEIDIDAAS